MESLSNRVSQAAWKRGYAALKANQAFIGNVTTISAVDTDACKDSCVGGSRSLYSFGARLLSFRKEARGTPKRQMTLASTT